MNNTQLRFHSTAAFVADITVAKDFYTGILGQEVEFDFGKNVILKGGITLWEINPAHIIPENLGVDAVSRTDCNRFEFYFETEEIAAVVNRLEDAEVNFLHGLHEEPWGQRTVRFFDPDRHIIEIGEPLEVFVRRLYKESGSAKAVADRTGVPLDAVKEIVSQ